VVGVHTAAHRRVAETCLRFGCPRIVVFPSSFRNHLGRWLDKEPTKSCALRRTEWDVETDLAVSLRAPDDLLGLKATGRDVSGAICDIVYRAQKRRVALMTKRAEVGIAELIMRLDRDGYQLLVEAIERLGSELRIDAENFRSRAYLDEKPRLEVDGQGGAVTVRLRP
jgi:hypothetical protein